MPATRKNKPTTVQCSAKSLKKVQCKRKTTRSHLCWQHQRTKNNVMIRRSPRGGYGLYARKKFKKDKTPYAFEEGDYICTYRGEHLTKRELDKKFGPDERAEYVIQVDRHHYIHAKHPTNGLGRWINDSKEHNNAELVTAKKNKCYIYAIKKIKFGKEILVYYGNKYWGNEPHQA